MGKMVVLQSGAQRDTRRKVVFEGEKLGERKEYGMHQGRPSDTRGTIETLYRTASGLVVHVEEWSRWQGEPNIETLHKITEDDLQPGGRFYDLGLACGLARPLTLDEALGGDDAGVHVAH